MYKLYIEYKDTIEIILLYFDKFWNFNVKNIKNIKKKYLIIRLKYYI